MIVVARRQRLWRPLFWRSRTGRLPFSVRNPLVTAMKRSDNCEQTLGNPGAYHFINRVPLERYRDRRRFVGSGVIKFAVVHDSDWDQASFALGRKLK